jgi:hypothetical protein
MSIAIQEILSNAPLGEVTATDSGLSPKAGRGAGVRAGWHAHLEGIPDAIEGRKTARETKTAREKVVAGLYPALPA